MLSRSSLGRRFDALSFFLADAQGALGPYLNVFLVIDRHWSQTSVGLVTTMTGLIGLLLQTPIGGLLDATRAYRRGLVAASAMMAVGALLVFFVPTHAPVFVACVMIAIAADISQPAVTALTAEAFAGGLTARLARNAALDHTGNVVVALVAGILGWALTQRFVFLIVPACAVCVVVSLPRVARVAERPRLTKKHYPPPWRTLLRNRPLVAYSLCLAAFHFANAPLLPLVGQKLALANHAAATAMMSACIIAAQLIMIPCSAAVGRYADRIGRKPFMLLAFVTLPLRAFLFLASDSAAWLLAVQLLDGVAVGTLGALTPIVVTDTTQATNEVAFAQSAVLTVQGIGAVSSGLVAGFVVDRYGYAPTFSLLGGVAAIAAIALMLAMHETKAAQVSEAR